jgi:DNA-binding SARP family transcriptional activator
MLHITLLGGFTVRNGDRVVAAPAFGGELSRQLVRMLAVRRGALVSRDELVAGLWPVQAPSDPAANLNAQVSRARRALGTPGLIVTAPGGYLLRSGTSCTVDIELVTDAVAEARAHLTAGRHVSARRCYEHALRCWAGDPLIEDRYADWAAGPRQRLEQLHLTALEGAAGTALVGGDTVTATAFAEQAVAAAPLRESAHALLIRALAAAGDRAGALDAYARLRRRFTDELGIDPTPQTVALQEALLRGEALEVRAPDAPASTLPSPATQGAGELVFVGREHELHVLQAMLDDPEMSTALIAGPAGSGKSRLLAETVLRSGRAVVSARAFRGERDEPWSLARSLLHASLALRPSAIDAVPSLALGVLGDLLPADVLPADVLPATGDGDTVGAGSSRALRREACVRLITAAATSSVLAIDDVQWADATSLDLLRSVHARAATDGVLVAYRPEELDDGDAPAAFIAGLTADAGTTSLTLTPLDERAINELMADRDLAEVVVQHTDRTPFAVAEVVRGLAARRLITAEPVGRWRLRTPDAAATARAAARDGFVRSLLRRSNRQPEASRHVLRLLALLAREAPTLLLAAAVGRTTDAVLDALAPLTGADLVHSGPDGWATTHDLIRETVAADLDPVERTRAHAAIAGALAAADGDLAEIAHHRERAGDPTAASTYEAAARLRLERHAVAEAERLVDAGLRLATSDQARSALLEVRAEVRARRGALAEARTDLRAALRDRTPSPGRARLLARMALAASGAEDLLHAAELAQLALVEAADDDGARADALAVAAVVDMNTGHPVRARQRADEALRLYDALGDTAGVADVLDGRAMATFLDGRVTSAIDAFDRVAELFADAGDLLRVVTPRSTRGHALVFAGRPADGLADMTAALDLAEQLGHHEGETYALWHRAEALAALGRADEAVSAAGRALAVARRIGHRGWTATALRAVGIARTAAGDLAGAEAAFASSLDVAVHLPLFASWAASRLALVKLMRGDVTGAEPLVRRAAREGPPLSRFEADLAAVEHACARGDPTAAARAASALRRAGTAGYLAHTVRLRDLAAG